MAEPHRYQWHWDLAADRGLLWPLVSYTERFNKAVGLPMPVFTDEPQREGGSRRQGEARQLGMTLRWLEHPFEWTAPERFSVRRDYTAGPLISMTSTVELTVLPEGGTRLTHTLQMVPRGLVGRVAIPMEVGRLRASFERAYRRIDRSLSPGKQAQIFSLDDDPFEAPADHLTHDARVRLDALLATASAYAIVDRDVLACLSVLIATAPDHVVEMLRPFALARQWEMDKDNVLDTFLAAANVGLLELNWSILCPECRSPSANEGALKKLTPQTHCDACNIDYETEFIDAVELAFKPSGQIRRVPNNTYCIGGPGSARHVVAQHVIDANGTTEFTADLEPGTYRLLSSRFKPQLYLDVRDGGRTTEVIVNPRCNARLTETAVEAGPVTFTLRNESRVQQTVRLDRADWRDDAVTASLVMTRSSFREFFSTEVLSPGIHVDVGYLAILFTDLTGSTALYSDVGDATAFAMVREHFTVLREVAAKWRGTVVKTIGDAIMAVWHDPLDAVLAALEFHVALRQSVQTRHLRLKIGVHWGRAIGVTLNDTADYFGTTVNTAARLEKASGPGQVALSPAMASEPTVVRHLHEHPHLVAGHRDMTFKGLDGVFTCTILAPQADD